MLTPAQSFRLPRWLIEFLTDLTGKNLSLYTTTDLIAFVVVVVALTYAAIRNDEEGVEHAWKSLYVVGIPLTAYNLIFRGSLSLALQAGINLALITVIAVVFYKERFLSDEGMRLLVGIGIIIPTYPYLTVFPLERSILPLPFNAFGFTLFTYLAVVLLAYLVVNVIRNWNKNGSLLMKALGKQVPAQEAHQHRGVILEDAGGFTNMFTTTELREYIDWTDKDSILDVEKVYAKQYASEVTDSEEDISDNAVTEFKARVDYYRQQDSLWVLRTPGIARVLLVATMLALFLGDILFHTLL